jgi:protein SCO1/2
MKVTIPSGEAMLKFVNLWSIVIVALCCSTASIDAKEAPALTTQHGTPFQFEQLKGKPSVVHFGFTHCPVICPTTLNEVANYMAKLGSDADKINFVFVSVDPERDTKDVLKEYIGYFDGRIIGVTGTEAGIRGLADRFGTTYEKRPMPDGGYEMAHVVYGYLLDAAGKQVGTLYLGSESLPKVVLDKIRKLVSGS